MSRNVIVGAICATGLVLSCAAASAAENPMACVEEIKMPYVTAGMVLSLPADIQVHIFIGSNGMAEKIDYSGGTPVLRHELDYYFKEGSRYRKACKGKTITFTVRYLVEGNETVRPVSDVLFRPPNEFVVRSHPVMPALDPVREPGPK
jgi:hypothetical protein